MNEDRMKTWESLFRNALALLGKCGQSGNARRLDGQEASVSRPGFQSAGPLRPGAGAGKRVCRNSNLGTPDKNKKDVLLERFRSRDAELREDFHALDVLNFNPSYDACLKLVENVGGILLR